MKKNFLKANNSIANFKLIAVSTQSAATKCNHFDIKLCGGVEDVAQLEYAKLTSRPFRVFSLDTGRLNPETYQFFDLVEKKYGIRMEYMFPDAVEVQALVRNKGLFSFYEDGHQECCSIRKARPLRPEEGPVSQNTV